MRQTCPNLKASPSFSFNEQARRARRRTASYKAERATVSTGSAHGAFMSWGEALCFWRHFLSSGPLLG